MKLTKNMKNEIVTAMMNCNTWEELKMAYVEWAQKCDTKTSQEFLNGAFEEVAKMVKDKHIAMKTGKEYTKAPEMSPEEFRTLIAELIDLEGVTVEVCGTWIWVSGNTKENKEALKGCGFRYAAKKKMWYKAPENTPRRRTKKSWEMSKIRDVYGSHIVEEAEEIA